MSGTSGFVLNLKGSGFEMMLEKGFRSAESLVNYMADRADGFKGARFDVVRVKDLNETMKIIEEKGTALSRFAVKGEKVLDSVPGGHFLSKKAEMILKIGAATVGVVGASGSAFAATGDFNAAARAGMQEGGAELNGTFNPENRMGRAGHNITGGVSEIAHGNIGSGFGRISQGLASGIEGLGSIMGLESMANWAEKDRVLPEATRILETQGAGALTREIIRTKEDPKFIVLANNTLPHEHNGKPMADALKDDKTYRNYEHALERRIGSSTGEQKEMWQSQLETIQGFRQALNAEQGTPMPKPAQALGMKF
jgi:hypothetical protein